MDGYSDRIEPVDVRLPADGIAVFASRHLAGFHMRPSRHPFVKVGLVTGGRGSLDHPAGTVDFVTGDLLLVPAHCQHQLNDAADAEVGLLMGCVATDTWRRLAGLPGVALPSVDRVHIRHLPPLQARRCEAIFFAMLRLPESGTGRVLSRIGHLFELLAVWQQNEARSSGLADFDALLDHLDDHFAEPHRGEDLAAAIGLPYRTFTQRFRQRTGTNLGTWLTRRRIAHASALLEAGASILDAGRAAGYEDLSHFYRQFKKVQGQPPKRWLAARRARL